MTATVVVLTALEAEYAAVRALLANRRVTTHPSGTRFEVGEPPAGRATIVLALTGQGNQGAAVLTERAIATFGPSALVFAGIAGALHDDLAPGDVVVATKVYGYHGGKDTDGGFRTRPQAWEIPHHLDQLARHVAREGNWLPGGHHPPVHFRPIAAGEVVLGSRTGPLAEQLRAHYDDAAAIEMESAGVAKAGHLNHGLPVLTVRGIGDGGAHAVAAAHAAAFALALAVEIPERPSTVTAGLPWPYRTGVVPARADGFQDREIPFDGTTVLSGLGGVGKTQLAADHAERAWAGREVDLLAWIGAESRDAILTAYAQLAKTLTGIEDPDPAQGARRLLDWLASTPKRWLLVLDDVQHPADLKGLWPPASETGRVVLTTRRRDAALAGDRRRIVDVGQFTTAESRAYLNRKLAGRPHLADDVAGLADDLGHLPLALAQAAAYVLDRDLPCSAYRQRFRERKLPAVLPDRHDLPDDHQATVTATWSLSIAHADSLEPAGLAGPLLRFASVLDPHGIPYTVLTAPAVLAFLRKAARRRVTEDDARDALSCLHRLNLVTLDPQTVRVHALVQRAARDDLRPKHLSRITRAAADALVQAWPEIESDRTLAQALRRGTFALQATGDVEQLWRRGYHVVLLQAGRSLRESGQLGPAIAYFQQLGSTAADRLGGNHLDTSIARFDLADTLGASGDPRAAVTALSALLAVLDLTPGRKHQLTLTARSTLARYLGESGNFAGAVTVYESLLPDLERVLGPEHQATAATRQNLAVMRNAAGDPSGSAAVERSVHERHRTLGPLHPDTLSARVASAKLRGDAGDSEGAIAAYESVLPDLVRVFGPEHRATLTTRGALAVLHGESGDLAGAAARLETLLEDQHRVLGPDHPDALSTRLSLAWFRGLAGDPAPAAYEALIQDQRRVLGPDHPEIFTARHNLAALRARAGDPAGAAAVIEGLLPDLSRVFGPGSPNVLTTRHNLARFHAFAGDPAGALATLTDLLPDLDRVLGPEHPTTLTARHTHATLRGETGDRAWAVAALELLLPDLDRVLGPGHPETSGAREDLTRFR
ncbi:FxSxx-COOH system tetratricopeptide repeat protein [Amycolatopsis lexingtonensis]|uniref:FxSxx-COOH system tetratricopeptide repeat protein n=1 Tax=Amycolatopsis lexingtonensis TaxID=218822 RepID=UPI003F703741